MAAPDVVAQAPSLLSYWRELIVLVIGNVALTGVVLRAVIDGEFVASFDRCKDRVVFRLNDWYKERREKIDTLIMTVETHEDRMQAFEASLTAQGRALSKSIDDHSTRQTMALEAITRALASVQQEASAIGKAVARVEGAMANGAWNGLERRDRDRRDGGG